MSRKLKSGWVYSAENTRRSADAERAIDAAFGRDNVPDRSTEECVTDLIANLLHYAAEERLSLEDIKRCHRLALEHFEVEAGGGE